MSAIIGKKLGMSRIFTETGQSLNVTAIQAGPCYVTEVRTLEKNGYEAVLLGFGETTEKQLSKPVRGQFEKHKMKPLKHLKEFRGVINTAALKPGDEVKVDQFSVGELVKVTGTSKGKGFQGVVKRHHFNGGPKTHGQSDRLRAPGSLGQSSYPSRVYKGLRMAGRMGNDRITVSNLEVVRVDVENNVIFVNGAVPGGKNGIVYITK